MNKDRDIELAREPPKGPRRILVGITAVMAGVDDDGSSIVLPNRALELLERFIAAARYAGGHCDELVRMVVTAFGEVAVRALDCGQRLLRRLAKADVMDRVADDGPIETNQVVRVQGVLERSGELDLARLWVDEEHLPTPAEVEAPGLWLARINLEEKDL